MPGLVALDSALEFTPEEVRAVVAAVGASDSTMAWIGMVGEARGRAVDVIKADGIVEGLSSGVRYAPAAWARVYADRLVSDAARVLYLDADTMCLGSLAQLLVLELGGLPLAACPDVFWPTHRLRGEEYRIAVGSPPWAGYFNSGMLVIDAERWRRLGVADSVERFAREAPVALDHIDQDALNAVLWDRWVPIDGSVWNCPPWFVGPSEPRVVHFIGASKPWISNLAPGSFREEYRRRSTQIRALVGLVGRP